MHLLTFLKLKKPGPIFRFAVMISQGVMYNAFFLSYLVSPKACHRFVGYIEEEAVHTYTVVRLLIEVCLHDSISSTFSTLAVVNWIDLSPTTV